MWSTSRGTAIKSASLYTSKTQYTRFSKKLCVQCLSVHYAIPFSNSIIAVNTSVITLMSPSVELVLRVSTQRIQRKLSTNRWEWHLLVRLMVVTNFYSKAGIALPIICVFINLNLFKGSTKLFIAIPYTLSSSFQFSWFKIIL